MLRLPRERVEALGSVYQFCMPINVKPLTSKDGLPKKFRLTSFPSAVPFLHVCTMATSERANFTSRFSIPVVCFRM